MPKFLNLISQSGKQEFVDISEFNKNPNAYGKYKIRMVDDSTGKNYDIPATMFGEAQKDGLRAWNMEKQTTKQKQVESPALQTPMSSGNLPADWGNAEMVNPKGLQTFGAPRQLSASEVNAKNNIQAALDALNRRKADGSNQDRDERQLNAQKRIRSAQRQMQDQLDYASYTGQPLVDEFNVKNQQEIDIFTPTGNEGKGFSMLNFGVAPTVARDENNLPLLNDQGMPIKGMEADNVRAAYQRQVEQDARLRELGLHDKTIEEKIYDAKKRAAELEKKLKGGLGTQLYQARFGYVDTERKDIRLELNNLEQEIRSLEAIRDKDDLALGGFFRSLSNTVFNPKTWDFGVSDLAAMGKMEEINSKLNRKEALTNEEVSFANSQIGAHSAMALEDEQMGNVYRYTKIGGESLPYMLDFILTGGYSGITKWGARQGLNAAAKFFTTRLGKAIAEKGGRNIAAATLKNTGVLIGDLASSYAMATSIQAGKTTADILKRHQGDLYVDENGDFKFEGGESMLSATAHGINAAMTENLTEKFGTHLPNINVSKMFAKAGLGNASRFLNNMTSKDWYKMVTKMSNRAGIQGYPGEVVEEYLNIPLNAVIVGDNSMSDLLDPQTHGDILGGMALSIGMMGAVGLGGHLVNKSARRLRYNMLNSQLNKADAAASMSFGDYWEGDLKDAIDNTDNANMGAMIGFINNHPDLSEQQSKDALMYIDRLIKVRGFNLGLNAQMKDDTTPPIPYRNVVTNINAQSGVEPFAVISYDENGNLIERKKFMSEERANAYKENLDLQRMDNEAKNIYSSIFVKDTDGSLRQQMNDMLSNIGITLDDIKPILRKNPLKRTEDEQFAIDKMVQFASQLVYPENEIHEEKDAQDGADLAEGTPVGDQATIDVVNEREANAISQWNQVADPDLQSSIKDLYEQGKTSNDIFDWLVANEYSDEVIAAFAELCNSGAQKDKFIEVTGQKIEEQVNQKVQQVTFAGTLNGAKSPAVIQVQDQTGVPMYVVSGDISIIPTDAGSVIQSDGLIVLRDEQGNFIQRPDTQGLTVAGTYNADEYKNQLLTQTQEAVTAQIQATEYKAPEYNDSDMESQAPEAQQGNSLTAPQPATQPANTNEQQGQEPEQEPAIPTDEKGNLLYHKAPIEATINDLYNGTLDDEEIMDFVQNNINESSKEYDKINKKKPKIGTDKNAYLQAKDAWQSQVDEAKQKLDYWNSVQNYIQQQTHTTPEEVKAAQDELSGTTARLEYARQTPEGATSPEQIAGEFVKNAKIQPEDFYRETGLTAADARKQYPGMLSNDGATIARLAEQLVQYDNDNYGGMFFKGDDMEARNYIIEALKNASSRKSLGRDMTAEEQEYARVREQQREDFYQEAYGMSYSDYLAFEEQEMPNIWRRISNFAPEQYDQMVAEYYESLPEDYFTPQNEQQNGTERQQDNGLADSTTVLPQSPTDNETGGGQRENPAAETGTGSEGDNQNEEVPGGTQGVGKNNEPQKKNSASDNTTDTDETVNNGKLNDTATQQDTVSEGKDTTNSPTSQENQQKTDKKTDKGQQEGKSKKWEDMTYEEKEAFDPIRLTADLVLADAEKFAKESKHKVEVVGFNYDTLDVKITVDGKASNITYQSAEEYGENEKGYWVYNAQSQDAEEFSNLLDEYNKGVEYKEKGFEGETPCAFFFTADAAIAFENWLNDKNSSSSEAEQNNENPKEKTWDEMDENEKMEYVFSHPLLTEEQIKNAQTDDVNKANALAYIKGQKSWVTRLSYFITYKNAEHNTGSSPADNEAGDTSQLDETNSGGGKGRRTERKHSGLGDSRLDTEGSGQTDPNQSGEQLLRSEDGKGRPSDDPGKEGDKQVPGDEQPVGGPDTGSDRPTGSGIDNGDGHNVPQQGGKGRSRKNTDANRRRADRANRDGAAGNAQLNSENIDSQLQSEIDEFKNLLAEYRNIKDKKNGNINSSIIPGITINSEKIEAWGRLIYQGAKVGYLILRKGHTSLSEWSRIMKDMLTPAMHDIEITDAEIDEFINEMWHCNLPIGDEVHTISEWSKIIQKNKLKEAVRLTLEEKKKKQLDAESVEVKIADKNNIAETLPYLLPLQQDDVYRAEMQLFDESHNDYDHAYGKGYMFTNGTGTGKTYTGLGIVKRFIKQGKGRVLILTPSSTKVKDWVLDAANLNIKAHNLEEWAKAHKTTATTSKAEGVVVTTYANFRQNQALLEDEFDLVIYDESHRLLENKKGGETEGSKQHYMLTNKDEQWAFVRLQTVNQTYQEIQKTRKQYDSEYDKEKEKFQDEADAKFYLPMLTEHISKHEGYPNLKAIKEKYDNLVKKYNDEVKPQLEKQAKESVKKTKVVFLSATPFNTKENLGYAEGYIFQYPQTEGRIGRRSQFYLTNFGSAYRWRNNRLESRTTNPEAVAAQEVAFSDYLQNQLGTMSGRVIDSEYDYSRDFPTVTFEKADELNTAFEEIKKMEGVIHKAFYEVMTNYQYTSVLFEAMKASCILPRIREHINAGRKVVLFHRRMESARPITPPFQEILNKARILLDGMSSSKEKNEAKDAIADYEQRFAHMLEWEKTLDLRVPRVQILEEFGDDSVLFFSGKETTKQKNAAVEEFNRDSSPKKIIVIQEASGKEGISLHDVTGENQRVLISLAMPQSPITALQIEGRIYRIGNKSNAIFEYPLLGLDEELITWGQRFNAQVGTTENLALGSKARNLRESFARAVIEHSGDIPLDTQGTGGKEMDEAINQDQTDPFDKSILDFYGNAKTSGRRDNREGKDYYPTPEPLGFMMVKWANLSEGESVLEPSAGHGAIARYVPASNQLTSVEPSTALFGRLQVLAGGIGRKFENDIFENYNIINKHDVVLMNPPFGTAGRLAIDHVAKAFKHLSEGGRIVAIIPRGSADAKFDKWIQTEKSAALVGEIQLPNITFQNAGTQVACRVVVIDKISNEQMRNEALENATQIELPNNYDKIEDFFEDLRGITMPARTIDQKTKNDKKVMPIIKEFKDEYGDDFSVEFTPTGILISGVGLDYLNLKGDMLKSLVAVQYARANRIIQGTPSRLTRIITTYETIKKMALKLADMSEEEMDDFVAKNIKDGAPKKPIAEQFKYEVKKNTRTGEDMHVVSKNSGVVLTDDEYNSARSSAKANGGYWSRYAGGFVFPSEVAARTFLGGGYINSDENSQQDYNSVGKKYSEDSTINDTNERFDIMKGYNAQQLKVLPRYSYINRNGVYVVGLKEYIERLRNEKNALLDEGENHRNADVYRNSDTVSDKTLQGGQELQHENDKSRRLDELLAAAEAEDKKRISRTIELRDKYGIGKDGRISRDNLSKMLRDFTNNKDYIALFEKLMDDIEHLGIDIRFEHSLGKAKGETSIFDRTVSYSLDYFARDVDDADKATVIIHELLHQELQSTIDAYNSVVFRGSLNSAQREAVSELNKIFKALKKEMPRNKNDIPFYGTKSVHEMVSELTDNEFREVLSNLQYNKKSMLQRIIDCIKRIIGLPVNEEKGNALNATGKSVQTLIENYNPSFDRNWRDKRKWIFDHIEGLANKLDYSLASEVDDKAILDKLNSEPTVKVYRAMQVIDGKLYPPMAAKVGGSLVEPTKPGTWYQADEHPELIIQDGTYKDGTPKYVFKLDKGGKDATGKKATDVKAAYNPYWHTSRSPLNDQFKSAWIRPNLVTVEVEVPESELTSGYKAQYAKDSVGEVEWKSGSVSGKLAKLGNPRKVILSRYNKVVRVVPESEIADRISEMLSDTDITIPENVVTPKLRAELKKKGVSISEPEKGVNKNAQIEEALAAGLETDNSLRYRKVTDSMQKPETSEEEKSRMRDAATSLAESINTPIKVISAEEAPEGAKNSKGYYDTRTGEVTIVLDNNTSPFDVQRTVAHEVIGHKGLRGLLGKQNYYKIMNAVYDNLPQDEKNKINEAARRNGWQMYTAMDEYLAEQAENMVWDAKSASLWQNVKHYLTEALRTLGFIIKPNLKDARYWLWLSKNQLKRSDVMSSIKRNALLAKLDKLGLPEQKVEEQDHLGEPKYAFRNGNYVDSATYDAIEQNLRNNSFYWKEAFIDYMQAYQVFQNEMAKGLKNGLMDNQNALIGENALTSAIEQQQSDYMRMQLKLLQDIIKKLQPEFGEGEEGIRNIENYLMMKHGLERNRVLFMRDWFAAEASRKIENDGQLTPEGQLIYTSMYQSIWYEYTNGNIDEAERDKQLKIALNEAHLQYLNDVMSDFNSIKNIELEAYELGIKSLSEAYKNIDDFINQHANFEADKQDKSGLTALKEFFSGNNYEDAAIIDQVQSYDDMIGSDMADNLMQAVQAVSQFALDEDYKNGLVTKEGYNRAKNMFRYYIPLRGFDETTMEDVYEYMTYSKGTGAKSLVHAKGRSSRAGSPLATAANMALNAIARGLRNQNKQRAYRLVNTWLKDNPTSVPPAIVTDLWVGLDANGNDTVFTPDITDDMTAEEIRDEIEKFKDKMRIMEGLGKASKVKSEASFRHRFSSDNHKYEHIVPLMINGRTKMIVFNGNPRPAQALRGDLAPTVNKEFGLDKFFGKLNRIMAAAFTSYNPTFMVTNLLRDTGFANNNIAVKEGGEYYAKFLKNQASLLTKDIGKYAKLKWNYDKGIAPRNEMEQYFSEFMKYGGKTGFVNQHDIAKLEKKLASYNEQLSIPSKAIRMINSLPQAIKAANERIENVNRFATYVTSRQMGRSVMTSIYDAKEVSVNFNRKGAAGNTGKTQNATSFEKFVGGFANLTKNAYLFFNASVQSLNLFLKNYRDYKAKMLTFTVGIPITLGIIIPIVNQILTEAAGDGDDDPYANLPEWTRRNNFCFYLGNGRFLKIPLPIELRAFYGIGDIAAGYLVNEHLKSEKNIALDMGSQLTQILPVDFLGEGQSLLNVFTPDAAKPIIQIATNTDWTGKPIYKDSEWNKYEPEYTKAFKGEFEPFVNISKWINEVSGGSDHVKGSFDGKWNNPAIWHAFIQGYGGGAVMDIVRLRTLGKKVSNFDFKKISAKETPVVKAILETPSEKTQYYRMLNKFYSYQEKNEKFKHDIEEWGKSASPLDHAKFLRHTDQNKPSREMIIWSRFREYDKVNKYINKVLDNPNLSEADRETLEQQAVRLKVDLVKILDQIED
jgi:hypothetical protein